MENVLKQFFASGVEHVQFSFLEDYLVRFIITLKKLAAVGSELSETIMC